MTIPVPGSPIQSLPTGEIFTGNPATVNDPYSSTPTFPWPNGQRNGPWDGYLHNRFGHRWRAEMALTCG